jgi:hypothetical protein
MKREIGWGVPAMSVMISLMSGTAMAQQEGSQAPAAAASQTVPAPAPVETPKRLTVTAGFDVATSYMFRGIYQEDHGAIIPPYADVGVLLYEGSAR